MVNGKVGFGKERMCSYKHTHNGAVHSYHGSEPLMIEDISTEIGKNAAYPKLDNIKNLDDVTKGENNPSYGKTISAKFGTKKQEDNYYINEMINNDPS